MEVLNVSVIQIYKRTIVNVIMFQRFGLSQNVIGSKFKLVTVIL